MTPADLRQFLDDRARSLGFAAVGVTGVEPFERARRRGLDAVAAGRMDGMPWFSAKRVMRSSNPTWRFRWARAIVSLAWPYRPALRPGDAAPDMAPARGRFAAYTCLDDNGTPTDYHRLIRTKLRDLTMALRDQVPGIKVKDFVDHGWAIDRAIAQRAGIGFCGKHAGLLTTQAGSYVLLAALAVSVELPADEPSSRDCGSCAACIPACPTGAIIAPGVIDARRCISYLTIEHEGPIAEELRPLMGTWAFGCDLCQEACPINRRLASAPLPPGPGTTRHGPVAFPDLVELLRLDDSEFQKRFAGTPMERSGRARLTRNAAIALGNAGAVSALDDLRVSATTDPDAAVRDAAQWATRQLLSPANASVPRTAG